ncbi:MAG: DUF3341 domain-containing protein [Acidobacteriia bacterium]|nr:DUF3341 domain-containing protein [Terriglobia bacterium]
MAREFLVATYSDANSLMKTVETLRAENLKIHDVYAPYPIHGLDQAMRLNRTRLPWVTLIAGLCGCGVALAFQFYTAVLDWGMNVGGKPDNSTLAFLPIAFELTVLAGGLATVAALLLRARLYPGRRECLIVEGVTDNRFALVLPKSDSPRPRQILEQSGPDKLEEKEAEL